MPVRLYDRDDPRYSNWTPSRPPQDRPPLRRATDGDSPLDASHATHYDTRNYGFASARVPAADADAPAMLGDLAIAGDGEQQTGADAAVRRQWWRPWPRRGQSRTPHDVAARPAELA